MELTVTSHLQVHKKKIVFSFYLTKFKPFYHELTKEILKSLKKWPKWTKLPEKINAAHANLGALISCYLVLFKSRMCFFALIRCQGAKIWNAVSDNIKLLSLKQFKKKLKSSIITRY